MAIPDQARHDFEMLRKAFTHGDVCLLECSLHDTPDVIVYAIAITRVERMDDDELQLGMYPVAVLGGNLIEKLNAPTDQHHSMGGDA
jgi:hypothetical protein